MGGRQAHGLCRQNQCLCHFGTCNEKKNKFLFLVIFFFLILQVGNEFLNQKNSQNDLLVPAMRNLYVALKSKNLHNKIKVVSASGAWIAVDTYPPSKSVIDPQLRDFVLPMLKFLNETGEKNKCKELLFLSGFSNEMQLIFSSSFGSRIVLGCKYLSIFPSIVRSSDQLRFCWIFWI